MTEKELQAVIVDLAKLTGWLTYHTYDSRRSDPGFPDLVMVRKDRTLFVELKSSTGMVTDEQREWLNRLDAAHQETFVWKPEHWTNGHIARVMK